MQAGDSRVLSAAREQIRVNFREKAGLPESEVQPAIQHAEEVASFLRANVVQGKREEEGVYSMCSTVENLSTGFYMMRCLIFFKY
jgi:hypothetical protein